MINWIADTTTVLLSIAGTLAMVLLSVYVPAAIRRRHEASDAYRLAFDEVRLNIRENPDCPLAQIAFCCHPKHLAAIDKFRTCVPFWRSSRYESDVAHYKKANDIACDYGSVFAIAMSEKNDVARAKRSHYCSGPLCQDSLLPNLRW